MNGLLNGIFLVVLFMVLVAADYAFTITDEMTEKLNTTIYEGGFDNDISTLAYIQYGNLRSLFYVAITGVIMPFLVFLSLGSSLVNRNQSITSYLVNSMVIMLFTPVAIYVFGEIMTNLLNVSILDTAYMASIWFDNFFWIMLANLILTLGSFVFVKKTQVVET